MPQIKMRLLVLFIAVFASSVCAQTLTETAANIRAFIDDKDYAAAVGELERLEQSDVKLFRANNYDYLLARASEKNGDAAAAMAAYQAVVNRDSVLSDYALFHLAQIARASGNLMLERIYLNQLLAVAAPDDLLIDAANVRLTRSFFESKNYDVVIQILSKQNVKFAVQTSKNASQKLNAQTPARARENLSFLAQAYLQSGKQTEAREIFRRLIDDAPDAAQPDDFALSAARFLDELDGGRENFGKTAPPLAEAEHLKRAFIYQFNRNFPLARLHYSAIIERYPQSENVPNALFQVGRTLAQEGNFNEAVNWFERVSAEFPAHSAAKDALAQAASAYARAGKPKVAVARYQTFIDKYPNAENLDRAYLNIVDVLRDWQGEDANALKWTLKTQEVFKGKPPEAVALFAQARIHISLSDWQKALADLNNLQTFSDLGGARVPGGTNRAEVDFLQGFVLENLNRYAEAIDVYLSIPDGRNEYYGWRATERLRQLNRIEAAQPFVQAAVEKNLVIADREIPAIMTERIRQLEEMRPAAQSIMRLTTDPQILQKINSAVGNAYLWLPDYHYIKTIPFFDNARQCDLPEPNGAGMRAPGWELKFYGRCEMRFGSTARPVAPKRKGQHFAAAEELIYLGLYDEAAPELAAALGDSSKLSGEDASTLALAFKRGDWAYQAVAYAEPLWRKVPADYLLELAPREAVELLYPAPYADALLKYAPAKNIDPRLLLSIMRQESRFSADVKSNAAARGLMQFISTTGDKLAVELGRENFKQDELYNPPTAILFGAQYLSNLFKQFPNQPQAVAASYNGGEDNVLRWLMRAGSTDPDRYVSEIVYSQSKDYVYKVMANYRVYQMFYDEKLK